MRIFSSGWSEGFDGPGRRWVVYLKGCNFRCAWCANPESISSEPQMLFYAQRGKYIERACPKGAVERTGDKLGLNRRLCTTCGDHPCTTQWRHSAFNYAGEELSVQDILDRAEQYRPIWTQGGGITFGGGEPTLQADELATAVNALHNADIHVAIETNASTSAFQRFVGKVDVMICDLKCASHDLHLRWTGCGNERVLANLTLAAEQQPYFMVRIPLVPGVNDSDAETDRIASFLGNLPKRQTPLRVDVLRLHHLGEPKYAALEMQYPMAGATPPTIAEAQRFVEKLNRAGLMAATGG
jgi:pyruvate formate lyase activating enzyme